MGKKLEGRYTIKDLKNSKVPIWIRCFSKEQGRKIGQYYYETNPKHNPWNDFDFKNIPIFFCYVAHNGSYTGGWNPEIYEGHVWIQFNQVDFTEEDKKIVGYRLIKQYPGCIYPIGTYEPFTTGEYSKWPEFWEPVYDYNIQIGEYKAEVEKDFYGRVYVKFGCQSFYKEDLIVIRRLFSKEIGATIKIKEVKITVDIIDTLLKMIKTCKQ